MIGKNLLDDSITKTIKIDNNNARIISTSNGLGYIWGFFNKDNRGKIEDIQSYIINNKAVIIFWKDGKKTVATVDERDAFDKEFGFCLAVFKYMIIRNNISRNSYKREIECIKEEKLKDYLLENFNRVTFKDMEKSRKFLKALKTTGKREKIHD